MHPNETKLEVMKKKRRTSYAEANAAAALRRAQQTQDRDRRLQDKKQEAAERAAYKAAKTPRPAVVGVLVDEVSVRDKALMRDKQESVALLLHSRARGMSRASLVRIWGWTFVRAVLGAE